MNADQRENFVEPMRAAFKAVGLLEIEEQIELAAKAFYMAHQEQCCACCDWEGEERPTDG